MMLRLIRPLRLAQDHGHAPFPASIPLLASRLLHTSSPVAVKRPQEPFPQAVPDDVNLLRNKKSFAPKEVERLNYYNSLERGAPKRLEKYGGAFGLRVDAERTDEAPGTSGAARAPSFGLRSRSTPESGVATEARPSSSPATIDPALRAKAVKSGDIVKSVRAKWRAGLDPDADDSELRRIKREAEMEVERLKRARKQARLEEKSEWKRIQSARKREEWQQSKAAKAGKKNGGEGKDPSPSETSRPHRRWEPTKKLTFAAMAGIRELHAQDPERWTRNALSEKFGISYEAVTRILRSNWRAGEAVQAGAKGVVDASKQAEMGKWSRAADGVNSPVPHIRAVYGLKRADEKAKGSGGEETE